MFTHAIESFEHALEHYVDGTTRGRKFAILHVDHAVELCLKEKAVSLGRSIYKSDGQTLSIHETFNSLKGLEIPERPRLEEIHDLRNTIQHKGLVPDETTTQFSIEVAYGFLKRFLSDELGVAVETVLRRELIAVMEGLPEPPTVTPAEAVAISATGSPTERIVRAYTALERMTKEVAKPTPGLRWFRPTLRQAAADKGIPWRKIEKDLAELMVIRGRVVHSDAVPTEADAARAVQLAERIASILRPPPQ